MEDYIDIYCERLGPGLLAEPLNAVSNLAFFLSAFFVLRLARRHGGLTTGTGLLIGLLVAIGTGSTLFHTFATSWAMAADTVPILLFQLVFLTLYARMVMGRGWHSTIGLLALFAGTVLGFSLLPQHWLNGSVSYLPAWLFLSGLGFYHYYSAQSAPRILLAAALVFTLSLALRSVDVLVCPTLPMGVHYFWHVLNAVVLYLASAALLLNRKNRFSR